MSDKPSKPATWSPPTRRSFMAMIGAAATALAIRTEAAAAPKPSPPARPRWIGHW